MIKVKDGYAKLIGTTYQGSATQVLLSNGGDLEYSASSKASTLVQRNASQHIYATYFNSAISDEALTDIGSVYVRNTSDTFIRRVSKTQFYSILDDKFVTLDTTQSITGAKTFSTSVRFANNASIIQNQNNTSNYTTILKWYKNGASRNTYNPSIGQHNTGGDGNGSICILPYPTETSPWDGTVGLFISKGVLKLDGKSVALAENYYTKTESDERYVNVTGDTMTGPLIVKAAITGTQLISTIATGTSPLKVTSTTVVTNLNSDLLDGLHETSFFRARGDQSIASSVPTTTELATSNNLCGSWNVKYTGASGHLVQFNAGSGSTRYMQFYSMYSGSLYWRNSTDSTLNTKSWKTIVDSANYTGIVLKIGTATKGSATLPIYLNAGTPTACSTTLGVSITGNAATATKLQTARTINGTSFDGTANIVTAYWGTARTISLSGAVTGSASVNGSQNVTITTTYQFGSIDGRYVGGNKTANHGSSGTAYTADTYSSTFVNKAFVAFAERGSWAYANNGYVSTDTGVNIPLAGTAIFQWGASDTNKTQLYITPHNNSGVSNPAANEMLFYTSNGSGYTSAWTRVLTHRNYTNYTVTKTGGGASGTWGISITGNAATANRILSHTISDTLANKTTPGYLYHAGGSNSVADKPSGVDAFGVFTMQTASGWYGQILMSSNTSTGLYWRTATTLSGGWKKILDSSNYTAYINPANFVTALGTSGNYLTWTKAGTTNNITVPYATNSNKANYIYYGSISNLNSPSSWTSDGYRLVYDTYSGSASNKPVSQDNANGIITLFKSKHGTSNQYVSQLAFPNNTRMYFRYASAGSFSSWYTIAYTSDIKDPANYYWANVKVSASSNSGTSPTFSTAYTSNWFRSTGSTGWYSESYGGGWHMSDSTWLRAYNGKAVYTSNAGSQAFNATGGFYSGGSGGNGLTIIGSESTTTRIKGQIGSSVNTAVARYEVQWYSNYARFDVHRGGGSTDISKWSFKYNSTEVTYLTTGGHLYVNGFHHRSMDSNNYVLLAGGSYKSLADFAKGNAGASNRGVYVTNGTVTAMTYYLNATINSGASGKLAYYSGTNSIDDYTSTVGSSGTPIYLSSGVPTACTGVMVKYWASYTINNYSGTSVTYSKNGGNYNFVTSTSRRNTGRYTIGTVYPSGQTWYTTLVWAVGNLNASDSSNSSNSLLYCTLIRGYNSGSTYYWYVNTADDASTNDGSFGLFFLCF